jgi:hypothetical protein
MLIVQSFEVTFVSNVFIFIECIPFSSFTFGVLPRLTIGRWDLHCLHDTFFGEIVGVNGSFLFLLHHLGGDFLS